MTTPLPRIALDLAREVLDLAFPPVCLLCLTPLDDGRHRALCRACWRALPLVRGRACDRCGSREPLGIWDGGCTRCRKKRLPYRALVSAGEYQAGLRDLIHLFKYARFEGALRPMVRALERRCRRQRLLERHGPDVVVHIPSTWARRFERGFDPAGLVARTLARRLDLPCDPRAIYRIGSARPQTGLSGPERRRNVKGVFSARSRVAGRTVLLVDDVRTTGSTLDEATRALRRAGARSVVVAVLATAGPV